LSKNPLSLIIACLLLSRGISFAIDGPTDFEKAARQYDFEQKAKGAPSTAALFSLFLPVSGFVYLNDWGDTLLFISMEAGMQALGKQYQLDTGGEEENVPYSAYNALRYIEIFSAYRKARTKYNNAGYSIPYDKKPVTKLMAAPFMPENFLKPCVFIPAIIAAALTEYEISQEKPDPVPFSGVKRVMTAGRAYDPSAGLGMYEFLWSTVSLDAGVGEEMFYRGFLLSEIANRTTPTTGLLCSSLIFGVLHLGNPGQSRNFSYASFATAAGMYFGWLYIRNDYQLSKSIAAHFWWDFTVGTVAFLEDPVNNPIGVKVSFGF
jgi:membrane protease YdiL (CAAX protease family)